MKIKSLIFLMAGVTMSFFSHGQSLYTPAGTVGVSTAAGKVGVGLTASVPYETLHVFGNAKIGANNSTSRNFLSFGDYNNVRLGEFEASNKLSFYAQTGYNFTGGRANFSSGITITSGWDNWISFKRTSNSSSWNIHNPNEQNNLSFLYIDSLGNRTFNILALQDNGTVGVGTACVPAGYRFAVDGKIMCTGLKVQLSNAGCWPDYVFADDYELPSLLSVEEYIKANKHLPSVPSASEVEEKGISVEEMLQIHMEKIEELTLYMIDLKKENEVLKAQMNDLK